MAIFDRFRNRGNQSVLPDEVRQYYQSETRQRRGVALLFALIALALTILIAAGLFFGGRAIYRSVNKNDNKKTTTTQDQGGHTSSTSTDRPSGTATKPAPAPAPATATPTTPPATTPSTGDTPPAALPHTGDEGL